ncbi:NAD(P)H-dependent flavin oxidoreductase [Alteribacter natronophilus]|uniref:NAD(P)H-dependent flavin oxidoreductase n=1 Tax=Alteribacter natronophilus TaxID=2583810 RepID=UPI00110DDD5D|nr:nitronate monooxygenase [Alteribacter natronophilus]TMW73070.1 2-nitropropane dioxygenase [Alteribacter natronophilus]
MSRVNGLLHIKYPFIQGGMGNISHAELTAAVSNAGGLGTLGAGTMTPEAVKEHIRKIKEMTDCPFAVNLPIRVHPQAKEIADLIIDLKVPAVSLSAGNPKPLIPMFKEAGIKVITVAASVKQAVKAEEAGADLIVAEGYEAAGINSVHETTTMTLIPQIADHVSVPLIAAGGIGDGRGVAAALCLGAEGVQMGTRLIATKEALVHAEYKKRLLESDDTGTVVTGRAFGKVRRLLKTPYAEKLIASEQAGVSGEEYDSMTDERRHVAGAIDGKLGEGHLNGGQIAGLVKSIPSVEDLFQQMVSDAETAMMRTGSALKLKSGKVRDR